MEAHYSGVALDELFLCLFVLMQGSLMSPWISIPPAIGGFHALRNKLCVFYSRYRHYGVYVTHEEDQLVDGDDVLRNPVIVLDKNSESYINLKYPIHSKEDTELTKGLAPKHKC